MKKSFLILFLSILSTAGFAAAARADDVVLKYHVVTKTSVANLVASPIPGKGPHFETTPDQTEVDSVITLLPTQFGIRTGDEEKVYDFTAKKLYKIDHAKKQWQAIPLYAIPVDMQHQREDMENRAIAFERSTGTGKLVKTLSGMVIDTKSIDLDLDMLYAGIGNSRTENELKLIHHATQKSFETPSGSTAATFEQSDKLMPQSLLKSYNNFLVYVPTLHPDIEKAIGVSSKPFQSLEYSTNDHTGHRADASWALQDLQVNSGATLNPMPAGYTPYFSDDAALNQAFISAQKPGPTAANYGERVKGYVADKDGMRAMLAMNEMTMSVPAEQAQTQQSLSFGVMTLTDAPLTRETLTAVSQKQVTKDGIGHTNQTLIAAKKAYPDYVYLLDVFRANNIRSTIMGDVMAGQPFDSKSFAKALKMYANAITENPWLATAYAELGDANHDYGDGLFAWICWEQAIKLKPDLTVKLRVDKLREGIEKDFPEYF